MKEITVDATLENIDTVTDFVNEVLEAYECSIKVVTQIDIAIDELFSNIARYAYAKDGGKATVQVDKKDDSPFVSIIFKDNGKPYNPLENDDPDITLSANEREVGGLGIYLVKKRMDHISYEYKDVQNILSIRKNVN